MTSPRARPAAEVPTTRPAVIGPGLVEPPVTQVLVVHKTHLDVGFTDLAAVVRRRYLEEFFPRAMATAAALRARGGPERFRWTTGSWILTEALEAEACDGGSEVHDAVEAGDLCWHALPFTMHTEYCDRSLFDHGLSLSAELDRRFGHTTSAAKVTDVPGHTRGIVRALAGAGVDFLHVGVNPASAVPQVPLRFRWVDGTASVNVMYQPGGYGDVQVVPGTGTAIAIDLTGDNLGPRGAAQVIARFAELQRSFPGAEIRAASLDDVAAVMRSVAHELAVVTDEIGDTWIHGVGTDPAKTAGFRELSRLRRRWITGDTTEGRVDGALVAASTSLLLVAEHTWGLDQKTHWPDETHWSAQDLARVRHDPATERFESSWAEQRGYLHAFCAELERHGRADRATEARSALWQLRPRPCPTDGLRPVADHSGSINCGPFDLRFGEDGAITSLILRDQPGAELVAPGGSGLGSLRLQTFDPADYERWFSTYNAGTIAEDDWWARWDNTKPGLGSSGAWAGVRAPELVGLHVGRRDGHDLVVAELDLGAGATGVEVRAAIPAAVQLTVRVPVDTTPGHPQQIEFELCWFDKPAARWPEATWWGFAPVVSDPQGWRMRKFDESVSPFEVVAGGAKHLHCADRVDHPDGVELEFLDTSLVAPGDPRALVWDDSPPDLSRGWHLCLHDNLWGTNFPMWAEGDARFRVVLRCGRT